jgi:UDP-N-acetylmuramate--alanine ligase
VIIAESDESDGSFLLFSPSVAVVTNIDFEHLNYYGSIEVLEKAFTQFLTQVTEDGLIVVFQEDLHLARIRQRLPAGNHRISSFGFTGDSEWMAWDITPHEEGITFEAIRRGEPVGRIQLAIPGRHNVLNALATLAVAEEFRVDFDRTRDALREFAGVQRRFQIYGEREGATIEAARECYPRRLVVLFQPHRYTRTRELYREFTTAFSGADVLLITEIYPASEPPISGVNGEWLANGIREAGHPKVEFVPRMDDALSRVRETVRPGDLLLTLGAGNVFQVAQRMAAGTNGG